MNPSNNVNYTVAVKVPLQKIASTSDLFSPRSRVDTKSDQSPSLLPSPLDVPEAPTQTMGNLGQLVTETKLNEISHLNAQRTIDVLATPDGRDLGASAQDIKQVLDPISAASKRRFHPYSRSV